MAKVNQGRWTAEIDGDFVVFLIGTRLNTPWQVLRWIFDVGDMPRLLKYLMQHPDKGLLGYKNFGLTNVQYWRSFEHLEAFAKDPNDPHAAAWRKYWKRVGKSTRSGIWHETFLVRAGEYEAIYGNMPPTGLGRAGRLMPLSESTSARKRLRRRAS
jgi:hypothetical protein